MERVIKWCRGQAGLLFVLILGFLSVSGLFHAGLFPTHDGEYHVIRFFEFDQTLRAGSWYPVWASDLNFTYGSPLFNYVYPLPNYIASFFHLFGSSFIDAFKLNFILASIVGAISAYYFGRERFGVWGGVLTSVFYTYAPYHFLDIYIRGSVGEVWALALFPLCLLSLELMIKKPSFVKVVIFAVSYALVIFSHNILAVMFSFFAGSYSLLVVIKLKDKQKTLLFVVAGFFLGLLLSSVFILPALIEQKYVVGLKVFNIADNFPELFQLLIPSWGSGFSGGNIADQMSFQVGLANLCVIVLTIFGLIFKKIAKTEKLYIVFLLTWFILLFFLITPYSKQVWSTISPMGYFQFPWRFLSLVILVTALLAGAISVIFKSKIIYIILIVLAVSTTYSYAHAPYFFNRDDAYYTTKSNFIYGTNSIGDVFQTKWLPQQKKLPDMSENLFGIKLVSKNAIKQVYTINSIQNQSIRINTAYFPGWTAYLDSKQIDTENAEGKIRIRVPKGKHTLILYFQDTLIRSLAKVISGLALLIIICILGRLAVIQLSHEGSH